MVAEWPVPDPSREDPVNDELVAGLQEIVGATRNLRAEYGVPAGGRVTVRLSGVSPAMRSLLDASGRTLADLARVGEITYDRVPGEIGASAILTFGAELFVPLAEVIDLDRERGRLRSELDRITGLIEATENRLANETFVSRAPVEVVGREREKLSSFAEQREKLSRSLATLEGVN
jgi:valyl-tRNA synthetase